ncbi:MAG TPA: glycosyltransferase family 4 protein [Candidatus Polarisedimenticolia bacterium]|jgi:glycosyltransferase involved in cell wall biosynthesis
MSLHVGMFVNYFSLVKGGAEMHAADLSAHLERLGCRVTIVAGRSLFRGPAPARADARIIYEPCLFELKELSRRLSPRLEWLVSSASESAYAMLARRHMGRFDVVHCHGGDTARVALASSRRRGPVVLTLHGPCTAKPRVGRLLRSVDAVVSPSEAVREIARRDHGVEARLIPMGVDLDRFMPVDRAQARCRLGWEDRPTVCFAGRLIKVKDVPTLLRAFSLVARGKPEARLKVAGEGVLSESLRRYAVSLRIVDKVDFLGALSRADLPLFYSAADVVAMPSLFENFPMVALEALACGARLIVTHEVRAVTTRFPEVASFAAGDHETLAALLLAGLEGRVHGVDRSKLAPHSWERIAAAHLDLYQDLTARRAA